MNTPKPTKPCTFFPTALGCRNGSTCTFSHDETACKTDDKPVGKPVDKPVGKPVGKPACTPEATSCKWGDCCTSVGCTRVHPSNLEELRKLYASAMSKLLELRALKCGKLA